MSRRSPRKKASPITIVDSDEEDFQTVASDDQYLSFCIIILNLSHFFFFCSKEANNVDDPAHSDEEEDEMLVAFTFISSTIFSYSPSTV